MFMKDTGKWKLPSTPCSTGLNRTQHLNIKMVKFRNIRRCVHTVVIMDPSMLYFHAISWKAAYGTQIKESVCPKRKKQWAELNKVEFWNANRTYKACISKKTHQRTAFKRKYILLVIQYYSNRNIGTAQLKMPNRIN
jgi:hypothetical protein